MRAAEVKLQPGSVFATEYRIVGQLDEGGMGLLYRAEQLSTGEERALKVLKPALLADGVSRERFSQEATIGANIPSDHVVKVIGAGIDDETGIPWIAMELLRGDNLQRVVRARGPLAHRDALEILAQLCHALGAAHREGIVHRDLKPENV
ncbi:MAG: serine/threonine-protein kinase, partial [Deltaproteobacteria bacterium]